MPAAENKIVSVADEAFWMRGETSNTQTSTDDDSRTFVYIDKIFFVTMDIIETYH